ncbi:MAG: hypothetical protein JW714_04415 [Candidatus Omnitrophica bacterium]|nr:hypothetical protein [Candidatus Omnitrophota bacterium]
MIRLEFEFAVFLFLLITIFAVLLIWLFWTKIKLPQQKNIQMESIWQCSICTYIYVDSKNQKLSVCPRCGSYNDRKEKGGGP